MKRKIIPTPLNIGLINTSTLSFKNDLPPTTTTLVYEKMFPQSYSEINDILRTNIKAFEVKQSTIPNSGNGLFVTRDFLSDEPITWYDGLVISCDDVGTQSTSHMRGFGTRTTDWVIDGLRNCTIGRGGASMANHNRSLANAAFEHVDTEGFYKDTVLPWFSSFSNRKFPNPVGQRILFLRATKNICQGEEIFVNYGGRDFCARHNIPY